MIRRFPDDESLSVDLVTHLFAELSAALDAAAHIASGDTPAEVLDAMRNAYARLSALDVGGSPNHGPRHHDRPAKRC